jgi:hypothetical protein
MVTPKVFLRNSVPGRAAYGRMDASPQKLQISTDILQGYY